MIYGDAKRPVRLAWLILAALGLAFYVLPLKSVAQSDYIRTDFAMFYSGAQLLRSDQRANLYDLEVQQAIQQPITHPWVFDGGVLPYNYPPYIAFGFMVLTGLSLQWAYLIWAAVLCALLIVLGIQVAAYHRARGVDITTHPLLVAMAFPVTSTALIAGQLSLVMLLAWWWIYRSWEGRRWGMVGAVLALTAYKPHLAIALGLGLLVERRWRAIAIAVAVQSALWIIAVLACGPRIVGGYLSILSVSSSASGTLGFYAELMSNIRGILANLGVAGSVTIYVAFGTWLAALVMIAWVWRQPMPLAVRFSTSVILGTLASPHLYSHDTVLLLLPVFCSGILEDRRWSLAVWGLMLGQMMLTLWPTNTVLTSLLTIALIWSVGIVTLIFMWRPGSPAGQRQRSGSLA